MSKYSLEDVKKLAQEALSGESGKVWFSGKTRSIDYVIFVFLCSEAEAEKTILQGLLRLTKSDFSQTIVLSPPPDLVLADEYGLENFKSHNWYVKLLIEEDDGDRYLTSISFHPVEKLLTLPDQRRLGLTLEISKQPPKKIAKPEK
jgi:hypothetical protein